RFGSASRKGRRGSPRGRAITTNSAHRSKRACKAISPERPPVLSCTPMSPPGSGSGDMGFRYLNRRRSDDLATLPWYIDGQIAVSGDYVYPNTSLPDPTVTPQLIEWGDADGSGSVQLPMIDDGASWAPSGYPFVVINTSTGSETVQVGYDDGSGFTNVGDPLPAGESGVYLWMGDEVPFYREIARIGSGGGSS